MELQRWKEVDAYGFVLFQAVGIIQINLTAHTKAIWYDNSFFQLIVQDRSSRIGSVHRTNHEINIFQQRFHLIKFQEKHFEILIMISALFQHLMRSDSAVDKLKWRKIENSIVPDS